MTDPAADGSSDDPSQSHGVHAAPRGDGRGHEEPDAPATPDAEDWADQTETGGQATK